VEGADGSAGLKVLPIDSVTLSDVLRSERTRADPPNAPPRAGFFSS
jgi:hypothetical protein